MSGPLPLREGIRPLVVGRLDASLHVSSGTRALEGVTSFAGPSSSWRFRDSSSRNSMGLGVVVDGVNFIEAS